MNITEDLERKVSQWFTDRNINIKTSSLKHQYEKLEEEAYEQRDHEWILYGLPCLEEVPAASKRIKSKLDDLHDSLQEQIKDDVGDQLVVLRGMLNMLGESEGRFYTYQSAIDAYQYKLMNNENLSCFSEVIEDYNDSKYETRDVLALIGLIISDLSDFDLQECLSIAYEEIKGRDGYMVNGKFVKMESIFDLFGKEFGVDYVKNEEGVDFLDGLFVTWEEVASKLQ